MSTADTKDTRGRKVSLNVRGVDEELKRLFKALCMEKDIPLREGIERLMREELKKAGRLPERFKV